MKSFVQRLPLTLTLAVFAAILAHGPIGQPADYHAFADHSSWFGIAHAADVLSNLGFALAGLVGWIILAPRRAHPALARGWAGYRILLVGLVLTAIGSSWYHLTPDDMRLVWDRLPIALACAGLIAAVRAECRPRADAARDAALLALAAVASVGWWVYTGNVGAGDLRPYLLFQILPLFLIPLWQYQAGAPIRDRASFGIALLLYVAAKLVEINDHPLLAVFGWISGHTLKHLLATAAAGVIVGRLVARARAPSTLQRVGCAKPRFEPAM